MDSEDVDSEYRRMLRLELEEERWGDVWMEGKRRLVGEREEDTEDS